MSTKPTHVELERAIASVPGVEEAHVTLLPETGRSRLRIRLANGEDAPTVSWAISATLRERFGIVLDPGAIKPRLSLTEDVAPIGAETEDEPVTSEPAPTPAGADAEGHADTMAAADVQEVQDAPTSESDEVDDAVGDEVVVIGDRVMLSEAARAVLAEAIEHDEPRAPLEGTTGPTPEGDASAKDVGVDPARDASAKDVGVDPARDASAPRDDVDARSDADAPGDDAAAASEPAPASDATHEPEQHRSSVRPRLVGEPSGSAEGGEPRASRRQMWSAGMVDDTGMTADETAALERRRECPRAAIRHLDTRIDVSDVRVTATLAHAGRYVTGEASSVPTRKGILRAVAEATVSALRQLTGDRLVVGVDSVVASVAGEPPMATVLVGIVTEAGEETLLGSSLVRQDPERAVMRATLDALNRRVEPWLEFDLAG